MPQIPGVTGPYSPKSPRRNPLLPLMIAFLILGVLFLVGGRWLNRLKSVETVRPEPTPQIDVPSPPPDPAASLPHASETSPVVATAADLAKPWSSADFFIRNNVTGEEIPATIVRLPSSSPHSASGYWAFSRKAPFGACQLEYITDLDRLHKEYDYRAANHPLVGNPCSRTLFDPLKTASLPGNIWIRGAIVQGSDLRPPLGVDIEVLGKNILAIRTE
jgi:hypothetical protein